ncbi:uncharacterized protein [Bemisia tabaci]|uniref:uncharacterized protein n=1 Tax=Bemisia tabaci TaxID=7038 RepID=UPI003B27FFC8
MSSFTKDRQDGPICSKWRKSEVSHHPSSTPIINTLTNTSNNTGSTSNNTNMQIVDIAPIIQSHFYVWSVTANPRPLMINVMGPESMRGYTVARLQEAVGVWMSSRPQEEQQRITRTDGAEGFKLTRIGTSFVLKYWVTEGESSLSLVFMG